MVYMLTVIFEPPCTILDENC